MYPKQTIFLGYIVVQLFATYFTCYVFSHVECLILYISTSRSIHAVSNMAVFYMLLRYLSE